MQEVFLLQIVGESQLANKRASMNTSEYQDQAKRLSEVRCHAEPRWEIVDSVDG